MDSKRLDYLFQYVKDLQDYAEIDKINAAIKEIENELDIKIKPVAKNLNEACIIMLMDTSGSFGSWEREMSKQYYEIAKNEIVRKNKITLCNFIGYSTEAKIYPNLNLLLDSRPDGGTIFSSGLNKLKTIINNNLEKNIYVFHFTDGDNLTSDCAITAKLLKEILKDVNYYGYIETNQYNRNSVMYKSITSIKNDKLHSIIIKEKDDVYKALKIKEVLEEQKNG